MLSKIIQLFVYLFFPTIFCAPLSIEKIPSTDTINFMKQYGYVEAGENTDFLYTEEGFKEAVKIMQKFGGLPQTGELDNKTLELTTAARCGVPDVIKFSKSFNRTKRYIIGSDPWRKQTLTYFLANWPPELESELTRNKLKEAFKMWSDIAPLKFVHREGMEADIIVAFGRGPHGDGFPFDGPGSVLAHAFFPYEHGQYGGDLHFDDDEHWIDGSTMGNYISMEDGVDFFTVAAHEIGHSIGLAHSAVPGSIMFPYYKGYNRDMRMDYDDIVAMYDLYVVENPFDHNVDRDTTEISSDNSYADEDSDSESSSEIKTNIFTTPTITDKGLTSSTNIPLNDNTYTPYETSKITYETTHIEKVTTTEKSTFSTEKPERKVPDICNGSIDAIALIRSEIFVFKGLYVWRMTDLGKFATGYPVHFHTFFKGFPWSIKKIDAIYQRPSDYNILFFTGKQYWIFDGNEFTSDSPKLLTDLGISSEINSLDAALVWAKNEKTYFFSGNVYWRFDEIQGKVEENYPQWIHRWKGVPSDIDAAFTWKNGQTYFFKEKDFWRFNNQIVSVDENFPYPIGPYWFDCNS